MRPCFLQHVPSLVLFIVIPAFLALVVGCPAPPTLNDSAVPGVNAGEDTAGEPVPVDDDDDGSEFVDMEPSDDSSPGDTSPGDTSDSDGDGVPDLTDSCPDTPVGASVDTQGCAETPGDTDGDGVADDLDRCPDTPVGQTVDRTGCTTTDQPPGGGGGGQDQPPVCGNGIVETGEQCDPPDGDTCDTLCHSIDTGGGEPLCGNGIEETGEECDPPDERTCDTDCQLINIGGPANNNCQNPTPVGDGVTSFDTTDATTDGPVEKGSCSDFAIASDVWFCHTATCTGFVTVNVCAAVYDTTLAVYDGCGCPTVPSTGCSDDDCEFGLGSLVAVPVETGQPILIRVGGFEGDQGEANLNITCGDAPDLGESACGDGRGGCMASNDTPGCDDVDCCTTVCTLDSFCCTIEWDTLCAQEAGALCGAGFDACTTSSEACLTEHGAPGCRDEPCCQQVCALDPFCCLTEWDDLCVEEAGLCP